MKKYTYISLLRLILIATIGVTLHPSCLIGQSVVQAEPVIIDSSIDSVLFLDPFSSAYIDKSASIDIAEIIEKWEKDEFTPLTALNYPPKFQSGRYNYWTQFQLKNVGPDTLNLIFRLQRLDSNFLYQFVDQQLIRRAVFGNRFDLKSKFIDDRFFYS